MISKLFTIAQEITFTLALESKRASSISNYQRIQDMENLPGFPSVGIDLGSTLAVLEKLIMVIILFFFDFSCRTFGTIISGFFKAMDSNGGNVLPTRSFLANGLFSQLHIPGRFAFEAFSCISKFTGALLCWFSNGNNLQKREITNYQCSLSCDDSSKRINSYPTFSVFRFHYGSKEITPGFFGNISKSTILHFVNEAERLHSYSVLSLAVSLIPFLHNMTMNGLALPLGSNDVKLPENIEHRTYQVGREEYSALTFQKLDWKRQTVEPRTGIEFPMLLKKNASGLTSENPLSSFASNWKFCALDVHPSSVCQKLGPKYASIPASKLDKCDDLYKDLLREDIVMSVRLVVNYSGLKINTVRE
ncbi:hypothetical protein EUTSA_v10001976mg [Eutrema salsugineum]|uniref:Uncharacterized protein n=1 Tax=Eutrema salsugineum TaxID=72664 RepID=V4NTY8_EUTSA|nr:hypothetical protein EUTSA_v10001976mg [Eutrema salsugineum]